MQSEFGLLGSSGSSWYHWIPSQFETVAEEITWKTIFEGQVTIFWWGTLQASGEIKLVGGKKIRQVGKAANWEQLRELGARVVAEWDLCHFSVILCSIKS